MSPRPEPDEPDDEDAVEALASIFARGVLRLRQRDIREARNPQDSAVHGLALCGESRPSVVDAPRKEA